MDNKNLCLLTLVLIGISLTSCIPFRTEKNLRDDIFKMQTRLLDLERQLNKENAWVSQQANRATKGVASMSSSIGSLEREIQKLNGEVDIFKYALEKGEMPGAMQSEDSLFSRITNIEERLAQVEDTQKDVLTMIDKLNKGKKTKKSGDLKSERRISSLSEARDAYQKRRYLYLKRDIPRLKKRTSRGADKMELTYLYAESLYKLGSLKDAAIEFHDFIDSKPPVKYLPHAKMRMGDCYRHLGDKETAVIYYEELISEYPKTEEADYAKERLAKITN